MNTISKTDPAYHRALVAFEAGDVDLAYRALLATKGSPSRESTAAASRIPLLWFFARMTSYERRYEESAKLVERIHRFELARATPCGKKLAYTHLTLANIYINMKLFDQARLHLEKSLALVEIEIGKESYSYRYIRKYLIDLEKSPLSAA